ncbi:hypothetical protein C8A03DRAFT_19048 [Achaetomium macrosporum]|uniref:Uncharacterized protein n=1 Tax=Achaetomium macrosporum TaxID=79813 RepID=A0AAN7H7R3_9PEZI|nr:hypothetical protein C8A03DRAFT_19048 [Achaetomium macrosporum]
MEWKYAPHSQFPESSQRLGDSYSEPRDDGRVEDNMRRKIAEYEDRILQLKAENTRLLQKSSEQENRLRAQTTEFARELEEIRSKQLIKTPSTCDSEVQGEWKALDFEVRQFVSNYLRDPLSLSTVRRLEQLEIFKWLPEMSKTLRSPFVCNIVLQSWVWHFLCFRIFDAHSVFWAGDIGKGFSVLSQQIRDHISNVDGPPTTQAPALSQLHNWRVRSTHLISQLDTHDRNTSTKQTAYTMSSCLGPVMRLIGPQDPMHENLRQDALRIVHKAAKLDRIFRLSRAYYHVFITRLKLPFVEPQSFGFQFDPETMELNSDISLSDQGKAGSVVDLAVSPGILKVGNSDGANYGSERVLAKLQVLCDLQGILERFERFRVDGETKTAKKNLRKQSRMRLRKTMMIVSTCFESTAEHAK